MSGLLAGALGAISGGASTYLDKLKAEAEQARREVLEQTRLDNNMKVESQRDQNANARQANQQAFQQGLQSDRIKANAESTDKELKSRRELTQMDINSREKIAGMKALSPGNDKIKQDRLKQYYESMAPFMEQLRNGDITPKQYEATKRFYGVEFGLMEAPTEQIEEPSPQAKPVSEEEILNNILGKDFSFEMPNIFPENAPSPTGKPPKDIHEQAAINRAASRVKDIEVHKREIESAQRRLQKVPKYLTDEGKRRYQQKYQQKIDEATQKIAQLEALQ